MGCITYYGLEPVLIISFLKKIIKPEPFRSHFSHCVSLPSPIQVSTRPVNHITHTIVAAKGELHLHHHHHHHHFLAVKLKLLLAVLAVSRFLFLSKIAEFVRRAAFDSWQLASAFSRDSPADLHPYEVGFLFFLSNYEVGFPF